MNKFVENQISFAGGGNINMAQEFETLGIHYLKNIKKNNLKQNIHVQDKMGNGGSNLFKRRCKYRRCAYVSSQSVVERKMDKKAAQKEQHKEQGNEELIEGEKDTREGKGDKRRPNGNPEKQNLICEQCGQTRLTAKKLEIHRLVVHEGQGSGNL